MIIGEDTTGRGKGDVLSFRPDLRNGDVLSELAKIDDESIDLIVTSPPYWGLRDYGEGNILIWGGDKDCEHEWNEDIITNTNSSGGPSDKQKSNAGSWFEKPKSNICSKCNAWKGQLGLEPHPQMFIDHIVEICRELKRVLKKTGSFYLNIGDTYYGSGAGHKDTGKAVYPPSEFRKEPLTKHKSNWLQPKQKLLIPHRVAIALQDDGWVLRNDNIWYKPNAMPSSVRDRRNNVFEYFFHFVKSRHYWYDLDSIREPHATATINRCKYKVSKFGGDDIGSGRMDRQRDNEEDDALRRVDCELNPMGKNPGDLIECSTQSFPKDILSDGKERHFAVFPEALVEPLIKSSCPQWVCKSCGKARERIVEKEVDYQASNDPDPIYKKANPKGNSRNPSEFFKQATSTVRKTVGWTDCGCDAGWEGGIVLDPFTGSGTTCLVAMKNSRNSIGIEINEDYVSLAQKRCKLDNASLEDF